MKNYSFRIWAEAKEDEFSVKKAVLTTIKELEKSSNVPENEILEKTLKNYSHRTLMHIANQSNVMDRPLDRSHIKDIVHKIMNDDTAEYTVADLIKDLIDDTQRDVPAGQRTYAPKNKMPAPPQAGPHTAPQALVPPPSGPAPTQAPAPTAIPPQM